MTTETRTTVEICELTERLPEIEARAEALGLGEWIEDLKDWHDRLHGVMGSDFAQWAWVDMDLRTLLNLIDGYAHIPEEVKKANINEIDQISDEIHNFLEDHIQCDEDCEKDEDDDCITDHSLFG